ncbi:MAG TPA: sigma-54 dependent transcriptional regulator [Wenzhouxiangella sp.]
MQSKPLWQQPTDSALIGHSPKIQVLKAQIARLAQINVTTLIQGQSGTGKELAARLIHHHSARQAHPWVAVNCAAIPADLCESELFGHIEGAFTGAKQRKKGLFEIANRGTVFLDEVGDLPMAMQVKLLRAIEERTIRPLGAEHERPIDVRLMAASHQDLAQLVTKGRFRLDLYHRLKVAHIELPSLDQIRNDLPEFVAFFLAQAAKELSLPKKPLSVLAEAAIKNHVFAGNIRELKHCLTAGLLWSTGPEIEIDDLQLTQPIALDPETPVVPIQETQSLQEALDRTEQALIHDALYANNQDRHAAADQLQITERSLRYRIQKHRLLEGSETFKPV